MLKPFEIFEKSAKEGSRRLEQITLDLLSTGFIAGFTIVFGVIALVLLALGPFEHAVVTSLHLSFGLAFGASLSLVDILQISAISIVGNLLGGVGLVTMSHAAQAKGAGPSETGPGGAP